MAEANDRSSKSGAVRCALRGQDAAAGAERSGEHGYNLVILMVLITVMNVALALALPNWVRFAQREKEEEAIFRGLQYAEGIRVFQQRHGRPPTSLEELVEVEPRAMRQLYPNPLNDDGAWGLLVAAPPGGAPQGQKGKVVTQPSQGGSRFGDVKVGFQGNQPGQSPRLLALPPQAKKPGDGLRNVGAVSGPILGVWPGVEGESMKVFNDGEDYKEWYFTVQLIPLPAVLGDQPAPRVNAQWIGRPFEKGVKPPGVLPQNVPGTNPGTRPEQPGSPVPGQELTPPINSRNDRRLGAPDRQ